ncbi:hypothetical protein GF380_02840 [Candidatus Uhrbacteria bacterium]|nr:hypothetical protein [Candidatus Uhrbacteria bacterium]MBD3284086.1 hypothetical protein [Candidatus Uhrbacteria bacterium]
MTNLDSLNKADLYQTIADLAREQGVATQEDWNNLVEEVLQSHLNIGELAPDQPTEAMKTSLESRWDIYRNESGEETNAAIGEDPEYPHA